MKNLTDFRKTVETGVVPRLAFEKRGPRPATRQTIQIWVVTRHLYGIFALVSETSFRGETSGGVAKYRLFSEAGKCWLVSLSIF